VSEPQLVFVLGCQRSGTTWLANIFDASPDTWFFMEPFSPEQAIFPELPPSTHFVSEPDAALSRMLQSQHAERLLAHKTLFASGPAASAHALSLDRLASRAIQRAQRIVPAALSDRARRFDLLSLNRSDSRAPRTRKRAAPSAWVIKELRLAGKIPLLLHAFPSARFVTIVRHPCATVHSIESWFARGRLVELRADLLGYVDRISEQPIGREYKDLLEHCRGDTTRTLALYWRISYETIARRLAAQPHAQLLAYEELASDPLRLSQRVLEGAGVPWSTEVARYVEASSAGNASDLRGITTQRDSRRHLRAWTEDASPALHAKVEEVTADSELMALFEPFYGAECEKAATPG
jgi:hypothetical protein